MKLNEARVYLKEDRLCDLFRRLYGENAEAQKERYLGALDRFEALFGSEKEIGIFSAPGRTEIGGNHTDHNGGRVLAGSVDYDVIAVVAKEEGETVHIHSEGFAPDTVDLTKLSVDEKEFGKSAALIRGVAKGFLDRGLLVGGFTAYTESCVPKGSGVSSSAAFEVLLGTILNHLYNGGTVDGVEIAKISQFAEREYFGKPRGLMDQAACAVGGISMMDFADEKAPVIRPIPFSFAEAGHKLCLIKLGGDHANLTHLYAAIPQRMKQVAALFGKEKLCHVSYKELLADLPRVRREAGDEAALAALHFCLETDRVVDQAKALQEGDFDRFLTLVNRSGQSSFQALGNVWIPMEGADQGAAVALNLAANLLNGAGACRIHGGGFGGTTQNFVPNDKVEEFRSVMESVFGEGACMVLSIRPVGPVKVL